MGKLTDTQLRAWVRAGKPLAGRSDGDWLTFTLSVAGAASWVLHYQHNGRARECSIERYPPTPAWRMLAPWRPNCGAESRRARAWSRPGRWRRR